jgi:hypothetical protein
MTGLRQLPGAKSISLTHKYMTGFETTTKCKIDTPNIQIHDWFETAT